MSYCISTNHKVNDRWGHDLYMRLPWVRREAGDGWGCRRRSTIATPATATALDLDSQQSDEHAQSSQDLDFFAHEHLLQPFAAPSPQAEQPQCTSSVWVSTRYKSLNW